MAVRIKLYGLLPLTRRTYLILQGMLLLVGLAAIGIGLWYPRPQLPAGIVPTSRQRLYLWLLDALPYIAVLFLLIEGMETAIMLRKYARKEVEQPDAPASGGRQPPVSSGQQGADAP